MIDGNDIVYSYYINDFPDIYKSDKKLYVHHQGSETIGNNNWKKIFNEYIEKLRTFKDISDEIYGCEEELNNYKNSVKRFWKKEFWKGFALVVLGVMITLLFEIVKDSIKGENPHNLQTPQTTQTPAKS